MTAKIGTEAFKENLQKCCNGIKKRPDTLPESTRTQRERMWIFDQF